MNITMRYNFYHRGIILLLLAMLMTGCATNYSQRGDVQQFIQQMTDKHHFEREELTGLFCAVKRQPKIIQAMEKPREGKTTPWYVYRAVFITPKRIKEGVDFWQENAQTLDTVEKQYGVPAEIIVAIIGVETRYGQNKGSYRAMDALTNLAFDYPRRAKFFQGELEQYLLLTREQDLDPLSVLGSYAGAIGQPQFMPSSCRQYGVDFSGSRQMDLNNNSSDAIASVANYFKKHGWHTGEAVAARATVSGSSYLPLANNSLKPKWTIKELSHYGITPKTELNAQQKGNFMMFDAKEGAEYWIGLHNFYVITRYNSSRYYAMAVYQLAQALAAEKSA
jgi:membrane-bound lytic murein transglycosylase B